MGILDVFSKPELPHKLDQLPGGTFTIDAQGEILTTTLPQCFPVDRMRAIGAQVLASFQGARQAQLQFNELIVHYGVLKITARELRGGAIVFLTPKTLNSAPKKA